MKCNTDWSRPPARASESSYQSGSSPWVVSLGLCIPLHLLLHPTVSKWVNGSFICEMPLIKMGKSNFLCHPSSSVNILCLGIYSIANQSLKSWTLCIPTVICERIPLFIKGGKHRDPWLPIKHVMKKIFLTPPTTHPAVFLTSSHAAQ